MPSQSGRSAIRRRFHLHELPLLPRQACVCPHLRSPTPTNGTGILIITPTAGLLPHDAMVRISRLRGFRHVPINVTNMLYRYALLRALRKLAVEIGTHCEVVLLGSIGSGKYLDVLVRVFAAQLRVPTEFIGRGDMSRGALLLRSVKENRELDYLSATILSQQTAKLRKRPAASSCAAIETFPIISN